MDDETQKYGTTTDMTPETRVVPAATVRSVPELTDTEVIELRRRLERDPDDGGGNRFGWFLIGFVAALVTILVAAMVFLVVSDRDDDGNIQLDVPSVEVDG